MTHAWKSSIMGGKSGSAFKLSWILFIGVKKKFSSSFGPILRVIYDAIRKWSLFNIIMYGFYWENLQNYGKIVEIPPKSPKSSRKILNKKQRPN